MSLLITDIREVNIHENHKDYEQLKESVEELKGKITDFNFLSLELDTIYDKVNTLIKDINSVNRNLVRNVNEFTNIYRDIDNTL
tara:strand:- start:772 stop:1023 length:252 start_codon:yes stop_codon:yes gene_type:complete